MVRARLVGPNLELVPFDASLISERYVSWLQDPDVVRFLEIRHEPQTLETATTFVKSFEGTTRKYLWAIVPQASKDVIGTCTVYQIDPHNGSAEFGLMIGDKQFWGSRASEEVINLIAAFVFCRLRLRRLTGGSCAKNRGMNFTFRRMGFTLEGCMRKSMRMTDGTFVDGYRWGLLADEWRERDRNNAVR